jgi:glutathionylspermidine synthase
MVHMKTPWLPYKSISHEQWCDVRSAMIFDHHKWDPRIGDMEVLANFALVLRDEVWHELVKLAEHLSSEILAAEDELRDRPELYRRLGLTWRLRRALRLSALKPVPAAARQIRFDFHWTAQGWMISEANTDVPGGYAEAAALSKLMKRCYCNSETAGDPAQYLCEQFSKAIDKDAVVGLVHASAYTDDRQVMVYIAQEFKRLHIVSALLNPDQVAWRNGTAHIGQNAQPLGGILRFFPAEWLANLNRKSKWQRYFSDSLTPQSNPATALLIQSKRLPLFWHRLSTQMPYWYRYLPETRDVREIDIGSGDWVLKPAFGRVGHDVGIRGVSEEKDWNKIVRYARKYPDYWIAQRRFEPAAFETENGPMYPCIGVYTIDGKAAGAYGRVGEYAIVDQFAKDAAILVQCAQKSNNFSRSGKECGSGLYA